jgi:hypothetical protein
VERFVQPVWFVCAQKDATQLVAGKKDRDLVRMDIKSAVLHSNAVIEDDSTEDRCGSGCEFADGGSSLGHFRLAAEGRLIIG